MNTKPKKNLLLADGSEIYSWNSILYLFQIMVTENKTDQYYVSLFVVKKDQFGTELKNSLNNDETFIFFNEKSFKK